MVLYVDPVPNPPAGADWLYEIPGQYIENVVSVQATLTTAVGPTNTIAHDASGNGNDGTYDFEVIQGEPGLIVGDTAAGFIDNLTDLTHWLRPPATACDLTGDFTVCWWWGASQGAPGFLAQASGVGVQMVFTPPMFVMERGPGAAVPASPFVDDPTPGPRLITWRNNGADWFLYVNTTLAASGTFGVPPPYSPLDAFTIFGNDTFFSLGAEPTTIADELAWFSYDIGAPNVAALYVAGLAGFATYNAAVLALTPSAYYHLDDANQPTTGRTPSLVIAEAGVPVGSYASSFTPAPVNPTFDYSWIVGLSNNSQPAPGAITTVGLPPLVLPAGYTIGTSTPDLGRFDQWSDITIMWDSNIMDAQQFLADYVYPPGAHLVYQPPAQP